MTKLFHVKGRPLPSSLLGSGITGVCLNSDAVRIQTEDSRLTDEQVLAVVHWLTLECPSAVEQFFNVDPQFIAEMKSAIPGISTRQIIDPFGFIKLQQLHNK